LVEAAARAGFEVLVTVDRNMAHQLNLRGRAISLVVLQARSINFEDLVLLLPEVLATLEAISPGDVIRIGKF
jgi:predicted nuclease of predicted toxin-antitoxin system